jgi:hypothetical protein
LVREKRMLFLALLKKKNQQKDAGDMKKHLSELEIIAKHVIAQLGIDLEKDYQYSARRNKESNPYRRDNLYILPLLTYAAVNEVLKKRRWWRKKLAPRHIFQIAVHNMAQKGELLEIEAVDMLMHHAMEEVIAECPPTASDRTENLYSDPYFEVRFIKGLNRLINRGFLVVDNGLLHITVPCPNRGWPHYRVAYDSDKPYGERFGILDGNVIWG